MPGLEQELSELAAPGPVQVNDHGPDSLHTILEDGEKPPNGPNRPQAPGDDYDGKDEDISDGEQYADPPGVANLPDAVPDAVIENPNEARLYQHQSLEEELGQPLESPDDDATQGGSRRRNVVGRAQTTAFIWAYLVVFSILGTLARLGLTGLTSFAAQPFAFPSIWPNFAGCVIMGFMSEGAELFHHPKAAGSLSRPQASTTKDSRDGESRSSSTGTARGAAAATHASPAPVPLHIGIATGFCGSFTSYSAFMRDCFEALSGMLRSTAETPSPGQDIMALLAVIVSTFALSVIGLRLGGHMAIFFMQTFDKKLPRRALPVVDRVALVLAIGLWAGAVVMAVVPPDRPSGPDGVAGPWAQEKWRGDVLFSLVFAPIGTMARFVASTQLNTRFAGFPLGTFCANMVGTLVLAVVWDIQRLPGSSGVGRVPCQVLQGIEDGFCGCLTTVSTWALEMNSLRRRHGYRYGLASISTGLAIIVVVMGSLKWSVGLGEPVCVAL